MRSATLKRLMEPLISIQFFGDKPSYLPGDTLRCDYQIDAIDSRDAAAVEASVLWFTQGKGDEDMGVHFFERRVTAEAEGGNLCQLRSFRSKLPNSPLSYLGQIVEIHWCVRIRVFLRRGREANLDQPFWLGPPPPSKIPRPHMIEAAHSSRLGIDNGRPELGDSRLLRDHD